MISLILGIADLITTVVNDSSKSAVATVIGSLVGYAPEVSANMAGVGMSTSEASFQYCVWAITMVVGILAIINGVQKQCDRYRRKKTKIRIDEDDMESLD